MLLPEPNSRKFANGRQVADRSELMVTLLANKRKGQGLIFGEVNRWSFTYIWYLYLVSWNYFQLLLSVIVFTMSPKYLPWLEVHV